MLSLFCATLKHNSLSRSTIPPLSDSHSLSVFRACGSFCAVSLSRTSSRRRPGLFVSIIYCRSPAQLGRALACAEILAQIIREIIALHSCNEGFPICRCRFGPLFFVVAKIESKFGFDFHSAWRCKPHVAPLLEHKSGIRQVRKMKASLFQHVANATYRRAVLSRI